MSLPIQNPAPRKILEGCDGSPDDAQHVASNDGHVAGYIRSNLTGYDRPKMGGLECENRKVDRSVPFGVVNTISDSYIPPNGTARSYILKLGHMSVICRSYQSHI